MRDPTQWWIADGETDECTRCDETMAAGMEFADTGDEYICTHCVEEAKNASWPPSMRLGRTGLDA